MPTSPALLLLFALPWSPPLQGAASAPQAAPAPPAPQARPHQSQPAFPAHSLVHPADADLYFEIPDKAAALRAYDSAPLFQIARDNRLRAALWEMGLTDLGWLDLSPEELFLAALAEVDLPREARGALIRGLKSAHALSLSISGLDDPREDAFGAISRADAAWSGVYLLHSQIQLYEVNNGHLPPGLDALGLDSALTLDPWDRPYVYRSSAQKGSTTFDLYSRGSDGAEGGRFDAADISIQTPVAATSAGIFLAPVRVRLVVDFEQPAVAAEIESLLLDKSGTLRAYSLEEGVQAEGVGELTVSLGGADDQSVRLFDIVGYPHHRGWALRRGGRLALGLTGGGLTSVLDEILLQLDENDTHGTSLAYDPIFRRAQRQFAEGDERGETVVSAYVSTALLQMMAQLMETAEAGQGAAPIHSTIAQISNLISGSDPIASVWQTDFHDGNFHTQTFVEEPTRPVGMARWLGTTPIDPNKLADVPSDSMFVYATTLDGPELGRALLEWMSEQSGLAAEDWLDEIERTYGFRPDRDLFGNLGGTVLVHAAPLAGLSVPRTFARLELRDPEAFWQAFTAFAEFLSDQFGDDLKVQVRAYRGVPYVSLDPGLASMLRPAFAVLDDELVIATTSTHIKREVKRRMAVQAGGVDASAGQHAVLTSIRALPGDATGIYYMDWAVAVAGLYSLLESFGPMAAGFAELPFDLSQLPPVEVITDHLPASVSFTRRVQGGTYTTSSSPFGPEVQLALGMAFLGGLGFASVAVEPAGDAVTISAEISSEPEDPWAEPTEPAADEKAREKTRRAFVELRNGLEIYRYDRGRYPSSIDLLTRPTKNFPRGFLDSSVAPTDGWGRAFRYAPPGENEDYRLWSVGPNGTDENGDGDDLTAD